ncbi:hypothetical protein [Cellvibrio japonicus]|uniref:EF-hand domain-containing protein n=1 Tax=Cellvibrio japonicus (strain Ueda107) TaxID=498211 RepID=B3PE55_CELJU|nr:hypothetical protein [Cellvibrio japonicus]ACE83900.1 hypothetical protein CJA_1565 [Cellvibrio japonicus Ueda107]QEI12099.1 hypothetical protein FY117_07600 [Cellvibrio japonicus]QEI15673.1 hypothetical protein FY116_07605 [Cellvibrio japonicus]QEI19251.1 hypothetical protein FY115_07600 [Cellvibrio japonicus]
MTTQTPHYWQFFRAGGFDQVQLNTPADLADLANLDQKLWAALACPTDTLEADSRMLAYIDVNKDGRIRARELLAVIEWTLARLDNPDVLFEDGPLPLTALSKDEIGQNLLATAQRLLKVIERENDTHLSSADTDDLSVLFPPTEPNGDGLIPASLTDDESLKAAINDIITVTGGAVDRSGEPAVSEEAITAFFAQVAEVSAWHQQSNDASLFPFGDNTADAIAAISALKEKVEDYFTRVDLAEFDPRAQHIVNGEESELVRLSALSLANTDELKSLPLAGIHHGDKLPLTQGINPAYAEAVASLHRLVVAPLLGENVTAISRSEWRSVAAKADSFFTWQAERPPVAFLDHLPAERAQELIDSRTEAALLELVQKDLAVADSADGLVELDKLLRFKAGLVTLLRNFVSFYDFYSRQKKAIFQAGSLFIDGKSCDLVVEVKSVDAHAAVASKSNSYLVYCNCTRRGEPVNGKEALSVVAAITAGEEGDIMVGRNGLFYDRDGNDWDATVVKVVQNAISVREAFWSPYRRISTFISDQVQKLAASRDSDMVNSTTNKIGEAAAAPDAKAAVAEKSFDIAKFAGIFAAIGLAVGALGTALAAVFTGLMSLVWWKFPLVILGIILAISGPSMLLAWFKLRRRSLGPILDGNGWAVNTQAKISIPFGAELTELASLPKGSRRSLRDPYEQSRPVWPYVLLVIVIVGYGVYHFDLLARFFPAG